MGAKKYPPLRPRDIIRIVEARGFVLDHTKGDHRYFSCIVNGRKRMTQVDWGIDMYGERLIKKVIQQTGMTRIQFYASIKGTAKKINVLAATNHELEGWKA